MLPARLTTVALLGLTLAGCGGGNAADGSKGGATGGGVTATWNATDACALLGKDKVAQVMGAAVSETKLEPVVTDNGNGMSFSSCMYTLADGRMLSLSAHNRTDAAFTPAEIESTKKGLAALTPQTYADVGGLSGTAYWTTPLRQLSIYPDQHRWLIVTMSFAGTGPMHQQANDADLKTQAIALAKAAGF